MLLPLAFLAVRRLDVLVLDDDLAATLGLNIGMARAGLLVIGAALEASAAVAVAGAIAFVGLLAPHAARLIAGGNHRRLLPVAMVLGATLLGDGRRTRAASPSPPPRSPRPLVVALLGAPYLKLDDVARSPRGGVAPARAARPSGMHIGAPLTGSSTISARRLRTSWTSVGVDDVGAAGRRRG